MEFNVHNNKGYLRVAVLAEIKLTFSSFVAKYVDSYYSNVGSYNLIFVWLKCRKRFV